MGSTPSEVSDEQSSGNTGDRVDTYRVWIRRTRGDRPGDNGNVNTNRFDDDYYPSCDDNNRDAGNNGHHDYYYHHHGGSRR